MKKQLTNYAAAIAVSSALLLQGCSAATTIYPVPKSQVWFQDSAKNWCVDTKTKADWYTASEEVNCDRPTPTAPINVVEIPVVHTDIGMISNIIQGITGGAVGGATAGVIP